MKISIPECSLAKAGIDLDQPNPFLLINGGYILNKSDGKTFTLTIDPAYESTLGQCLSLFSHNGTKPFNGWYKNIAGVPVPSGKALPGREKGNLFCFERDDSKLHPDSSQPLGSIRIYRIRRGAGLCDWGTLSVSLGGYLGAAAALVKDESAGAFAAYKEMLAQTGHYLKEIAHGEWGKA